MTYSAGDASWLWGTAGITSVYYGPGGGFLEPGPGGGYALISGMLACAKVLALTALDVTSPVRAWHGGLRCGGGPNGRAKARVTQVDLPHVRPNLCLLLICAIGSRSSPEVCVMEP